MTLHQPGILGRTSYASHMDIVVEDIPPAVLKEQGPPLFERHFQELRNGRDLEVAPAWALYDSLTATGALHCIGAFGDGQLIGYSVNLYMPRHLHYRYSYIQNDVLFVDEPYRRSSVGARLIKATRHLAERLGVDQIMWHCKKDTQLHQMMDRSDRHSLADLVYTEDL